MKTPTVNDKDYLKAKKLLADNGIPTEPDAEPSMPLFRKSNAKPGETPAGFGVSGPTMNGQWHLSERKHG